MIDTIVDINHDNEIDFAKAQANGIVAIIHKASEGATFKDDGYRSRRDTAIGMGFLWGAYHFSSSRPSNDQVDNFLDAIQWGGDRARDKQTLICLDWEPSHSGPDMTLHQAEEFVLQVKDKTGRYPMIYGSNLISEGVGNSENKILKHCPLWYARYREKPIGIPVTTWDDYTLWQYTDGRDGPEPHSVPGMGGTDRNRFAGSTAQLKHRWPFASFGPAAAVDFVHSRGTTPAVAPSPTPATFAALIASLGLRHFDADEILAPTFNTNAGVANSRPPQTLWKNILPTIFVLDEIRERGGVAISLNSTYRSKAYNTTLDGAAPKSQHLDFRAIDFNSSKMSPSKLAKIAEGMRGKKFTMPIAPLKLVSSQAPLFARNLKIKSSGGKTTFEFHGGIQDYNSFVHIDCRGQDVSWA